MTVASFFVGGGGGGGGGVGEEWAKVAFNAKYVYH